jgi:hypothetical protein
MKNFMIRIDSNYPIEEILQFCKESQNDTRPAAVNMDFVDWETKPHTLLYVLYKQKRFDGPANGYVICKKDDRIVCGQGFYASEIDRMVCVGTRSYTVPGINCSALHGDIKDFVHDVAKENGMAGSFISMNEYNKRFVDGYTKINDPANFKTSFCDEDGQWWARKDRKIHLSIPHHSPIKLNYVKQWIIYHLWDSSYAEQLNAKLKTLEWID